VKYFFERTPEKPILDFLMVAIPNNSFRSHRTATNEF